MNLPNHHKDVIIVGAGLSGICAAYHLQTQCPQHSYTILEMRAAMGGTWDLFRYPGIRSDSDMYTLGYAFRPWQDTKSVAEGSTILQYINETAKAEGIDKKIQYNHQVISASWSSTEARWTIEAAQKTTGQTIVYTCSFFFVCSGYYNYEHGYTPRFKDMDKYQGCIAHPQQWNQAIDYTNKRVIVIGSGATAVTLVPAMAQKAAEVVMLQRSPSYVAIKPSRDKLALRLQKFLPDKMVHGIVRRRNIFRETLFYQIARRKPQFAKKMLLKGVRQALGEDFDIETHFTPAYNPWDQRVCLVPDNDLFKVIKQGKAKMATDHIHSFTEKGVQLESGIELHADLIVTATGLDIKFLGGMQVTVDGKIIDPSEQFAYRGLMLNDVPNFVQVTGYTNISWTLKAGLACEYVCRLLKYMGKKGFKQCTPRLDSKAMGEIPLITLEAGYFARATHKLPKQGTHKPWKLYQNYFLDIFNLRYSSLKDKVLEYK